MEAEMTKLITGATGQIGSELIPVLAARFGVDNIVAVGHSREPAKDFVAAHYYSLDVRNHSELTEIVARHKVDTIFHLAAVLSAVAEDNPQRAWDININGLINVLECARQQQCSVFFPSSIGAFGPETPRNNTPQDTIQRPNTIYGVSKVSGELLCDYYVSRYGMDVRGLRFPGLISFKTPPGGGTTDYAVEIFSAALRQNYYQCFLRADTQLDMMYMPDAVSAILAVMEADAGTLTHHNAFNVTAMSFTPAQLAAEIKRYLPDFSIDYQVDPIRQAIADSWPAHMDDSSARLEWGWQPHYDFSAMVRDMLQNMR
jgi:nucleoside-diphosphate-sugar epimerase